MLEERRLETRRERAAAAKDGKAGRKTTSKRRKAASPDFEGTTPAGTSSDPSRSARRGVASTSQGLRKSGRSKVIDTTPSTDDQPSGSEQPTRRRSSRSKRQKTTIDLD
ncbi:hypothetical protein DL93DRAFT_2234706 [Clavulina sp. PMI_390]|nr:hypothetical protein DL93DRAFT_2234706 [Clavulina sp. PMI_390]